MEREEKVLARLLFKSKVLSADGQAYEDLFVDVMQRGNPNFIPIKPQGSIGDRKNDGYDKTKGCYYQVFAPEDPKLKSQEAVKKLKNDFKGLKAYWAKTAKIEEFHFVFNDKYNGPFPTIETDLAIILKAHNLKSCSCFLAKHLEAQLFSLQDDEIIAVVGFLPTPVGIPNLGYSVLHEVINHILTYDEKSSAKAKLNPPDFSKKIKFNGLGREMADYLNAASYRVGILEDYFQANSDFTKQELRDTLSDMYQKALKKKYPVIKGTKKSDMVFTDILQSASPRQTVQVRTAVLILMAYFFESCDIFESP